MNAHALPSRAPLSRRRFALVAGLLLSLAIAGTAAALPPLTNRLLIAAPSPELSRGPAPADARVVEVRGAGATLRGWVFDPPTEPRGTVLLLHGIRSEKRHLVGSARRHAQRGYRAIALDARGHGESSGRHLTYGVEEARDLAAVLDELERRALAVPPIAVVGTSYGAATALQHAALDPRVARVVALAPFASLREVVRAYLRWQLGAVATLVPEPLVDALIDGAARQAAFDADEACPRCVAPRIRASVLLIHSRDDERIPWQHSLTIQRALRAPSRLMLVDGASHVGIGNAGGVTEAIERWLEAE